MKRLDVVLWGLAAAAMMAWLAVQVHRPADRQPPPLTAAALLGADPAGFALVTGPEPLHFPDDHGAHPEYRNEWWYLVGNLESPDGDPFGYQFTLFRFALDQDQVADSAWAAGQVWMAHLALSDVSNQNFHQQERLVRGALGLAGAQPDIWWLRDWSVEATDHGWRLAAGTDGFGIDLDLVPVKPVALQGQDGYSRKGPEPGNASRYYSITRIDTRGTIRVGGEEMSVSGWSWLDREWGSSQLGELHIGWDWFSLQFDDGRELMYYRLRRRDGSASEYSSGVLVDADGTAGQLRREDVDTRVLRWWVDSDGTRWPVAWRLEVPAAGLDLAIEPVMEDQLWRGTVRYWEGAVRALETGKDRMIGRGYLELSGYAD